MPDEVRPSTPRRILRNVRGDVVHGVALTWTADLERWRSRRAADWVAYCEGGLAALDALATELQGE